MTGNLHCHRPIGQSGMQNDPGRRHLTEGNASGVPAPFVLTELLRLIQPFSFKAFLIHGLLFQEVRHVDPQGTTVTTMKGGKRVEEAISVTNHLDHARGDMGRGLPTHKGRSTSQVRCECVIVPARPFMPVWIL